MDKAKLFLEIARHYKIPALINSNITVAKTYSFDGIHFTSKQTPLIKEHNKHFLTVASTHSDAEIADANEADFITFSPIFDSKGRKGVGIERLKEVVKKAKPKVFALGGIVSNEEVEIIKQSEAFGFASIGYFIKE